MDIPKSCDVAVLGGGPAGSTAATMLAQQGYEVVLLEKAKHPRYNVGESLIPHFWKYCEATGADKSIEAEGFIQKAGGTVHWDGVIRQMSFKDFGYSRPALHVERDRFDYLLLEHARRQQVAVFEQVTASKVHSDGPDRARVVYRRQGDAGQDELACRFVVDATGQAAVVARQRGLRMLDEGFRFMSLWGYFKDSKYVGADGRAHEHQQIRQFPPTTFVCSVGRWGWVWHIPQREQTSVGFVLPKDALQQIEPAKAALETHFRTLCNSTPYLDRLLESGEFSEGSFRMLRDYSFYPTELTGPGFFLVGDAAAFTDPIFSIGIVLAMYSAALAAWSIDRCLKNPTRTEANQAMFAQQFRSRLETSRALALPRDRYSSNEQDNVNAAFQFETSLERELMSVVSTLTTRSENFVEMSRQQSAAPPSKFRILEDIIF